MAYGAALALILLMVLLAGWWGEKEMIFPEILALAVGMWVAEKPHWHVTAGALCLAPTLAAGVGVLLVRYSQLPTAAMILLAFVLTALLLETLRANLMPAISAGILPILIGNSSWSYPLAVAGLCVLVALGGMFRARRRNRAGERSWLEHPAPRQSLSFWSKLLAIVALPTVVAPSVGLPFLIAPPLIVTLVEASLPQNPSRRRLPEAFFLLTGAAWGGMLAQSILVLSLGWPDWVAAALVVTALFALFEWRDLRLPPAGAIALLPLLLTAEQLPAYPWQVMAGAAFFLLASFAFFREAPEERRAGLRTQ
jgi:hypothetical protein